jgi:RES domain-containing protein
MVLWRISNYADLRGLGGLRAPGRWHLAGHPVVYLAEHPAAALLEILVHAELPSPANLPNTYQLMRIDVRTRASIAEIGNDALPADWRDNLAWSREAGNEWLAGGSSVLLRVPSAVTPYTHNYLMNPQHAHTGELEITRISVVEHDPRILNLLGRE